MDCVTKFMNTCQTQIIFETVLVAIEAGVIDVYTTCANAGKLKR